MSVTKNSADWESPAKNRKKSCCGLMRGLAILQNIARLGDMFTHPALLWFLPILGAVILIHLINMFRHRRVEWAAMEFILASYKKSRTRILLQQIILMLLRTLAAAVIIFMFAGPKLEGNFAQWIGSRGVHHIVLLDDSYSMNERNLAQGGTLLFDEAVAVVQKIADSKSAAGGSNDRFTLLKLSSSEPVLYELPLNADGLQSIHTTLQRLSTSSAALDPEKMLSAGVDIVRQTPTHNSVVYFLSDFRRHNWENPDPILKKIEAARQFGGNVRMIRIAPSSSSQSEQTNLCLEQMHLVDGIHAADIDLLLDVTVTNYGLNVAENVLVTLFVDDQMQSQQTIQRLSAGGKTVPPLRFPVRVSSSGSTHLQGHRIEVRLLPDALPDDNQRFLALQVPDALEVLLITPSSSVASESSAQYVRVALAPGSVKSGIHIRQELPSYLVENPLEPFSAIFLLDIPTLEPSAVRTLENYVANGGGVAFFPGAETDLDFVRSHLYKGGNGLFPARPLAIQELPPDFLTKTADIRISAHPIFRHFGDGESPLLGSVVIERYWAVEPLVADTSVNVWATLRTGAPLVLEKSFGAGKTMTFLTSASPAWNNWARNPSYIVILLELTAWLSKRSEQSQAILVGDPLILKINPAEFEERIRVVSPSREGESSGTDTVTEAVPGEDGTWSATFNRTDRPGFYTVHLQSRATREQTEWKAVNVNAKEGDIRQLDVTEISDILRQVRQPLESASGFSMAGDFGGRQSLSDWLLCAVILCLLGETFLAGRILPPNTR